MSDFLEPFTAEWLLTFDHDCNEPRGYITVEDRRVMNEREAERLALLGQSAPVSKRRVAPRVTRTRKAAPRPLATTADAKRL